MSVQPRFLTAFATVSEFDATIMPRNTTWLSCEEQRRLDRYVDVRRRTVWLVGRWLSKSLVTRAAGMQETSACMARWDIRSTNRAGRPSRPCVAFEGQAVPWSLSIAHYDEAVFVALAATPSVSVGVDVMPCCPLGPAFGDFWFSSTEKAWLGSTSDSAADARLWALKEAAYKALNRGESFAPRRWEIVPAKDAGFRCRGYQVPHRAHVHRIRSYITALVTAPKERYS